jgi:hypothetical protein
MICDCSDREISNKIKSLRAQSELFFLKIKSKRKSFFFASYWPIFFNIMGGQIRAIKKFIKKDELFFSCLSCASQKKTKQKTQ